MSLPLKVVLRTLALAALSGAAGLAFNAARASGNLALVAQPGFYDNKVFVPCPEVLSEPEAVEPRRALKWNPDRILVVDAREAEQYDAAHHPSAISFVYSVLFAPEESEIKDLAARAGDRTIVVCGDPEIESGRLLAAELLDAGLEQVYYIKGGCTALMGGEMCAGEGP